MGHVARQLNIDPLNFALSIMCKQREELLVGGIIHGTTAGYDYIVGSVWGWHDHGWVQVDKQPTRAVREPHVVMPHIFAVGK
jgi:hypothetical protein